MRIATIMLLAVSYCQPSYAANNDEWHRGFGVATPIIMDYVLQQKFRDMQPTTRIVAKGASCFVVGYGIEEIQGATNTGVNDANDAQLVVKACAATIIVHEAARFIIKKFR